ncbi:hypothetical protein DPMN_165628 [Dreissena polymorpha]|uniref:EB domain-containing protein n=1 Tax=Dreissena polymorpha TaxID=45954 RepID=A0A9D4IWL1_DREPO|nr:hypothetical protein DPMN_165628 [Dreissena polymorpha]
MCLVIPETSDGACQADAGCLYKQAVCVTNQCTCPSSMYPNDVAEECQNSKRSSKLYVTPSRSNSNIIIVEKD